MLARKLLDDGNPKDAYAVARDATPPDSSNYRSEHQFMAGWIALRYLQRSDAPPTRHFAKIAESAENPISLARGAYWTGRAAEALHKTQEAKQRYQEAARYPTAYYGQIARAKAGLGELTLNPFPTLSSADREQGDVIRPGACSRAALRRRGPRPRLDDDGRPRRQVDRHRRPSPSCPS